MRQDVAEQAEKSTELLVVYWEWEDGTPHAGSRFWGCHAVENDGRLRDWPKQGMRSIAAAKVTVIEGEGLDLIPEASAA
jgi:hypothetical protein